ncbi:hypothetical protein P4G95_03365 [Burkholderia vietnamiensis]|uniref:hypothetical protein n=1 Tax=Burkholderia vietnamiensis TaxID=60552 RepID=UPI0024BFC12C|nr:hypothetical protein [Burkholderia vietnamiensis]WHU92806.1 hypothetical protein P4G95_03365 [Burkholderia vietnamiensis]
MFGDIKAVGFGSLQRSYRAPRPPGDNRHIIEHSRVHGAAWTDRSHHGPEGTKKSPANRAMCVLR